MADLITMLSAVAGQQGEEADPNFKQTVLLLHGDGTNGAQNNTFLDSSTNNFTITRNGNTTQGTFSPFSGPNGYWSNFFDGNDYINSPSSTASSISGDYLIEGWVYFTSGSFSTAQNVCSNYTGSAGTASGLALYAKTISGSTVFRYFINNAEQIIGTSTVVANTWYHLAVSRVSGSTRMFVNGVQEGSTYSNSDTYTSTATFKIGSVNGSSEYLTGYVSNLKFVNGSGVSTITVPTTPFLQNTTNQELLTCYGNNFTDFNTATTAKTITVNGNPKVTPFSPFAPTAAYSAGTNGGSGYFDGSGDFLTLGGQNEFAFGTGDFSIEFWLYGNSVSDINPIDFRPTSTNGLYPNIYLSNGTVYYFVNNSNVITSSSVISANTWNHIAVTRSGTSTKLWINGTQSGSTYTDSTNYIVGANRPIIGARGFDTTAGNLNGYISGVRIVKGSAVYTSAFTPPTAPLTAITNTSLLLNFTNAGIIDNTGKNNLETVGNAQIDTTTKKYGTGSLEFDGSGDRLVIPYTQDLLLGSGDFTVELWLYKNANTAYMTACGNLSTANSSAWQILSDVNGTKISWFSSNAFQLTSTNTLATSTWYHVAFVRSGSSFKLYVNGTEEASTTNSVNFNVTNALFVGHTPELTAGRDWNGYIDDLRITKGVARYTANFTAPTKAFPDQ